MMPIAANVCSATLIIGILKKKLCGTIHICSTLYVDYLSISIYRIDYRFGSRTTCYEASCEIAGLSIVDLCKF